MSGLLFGLDLGIRSCGWAVLRVAGPGGAGEAGSNDEILGMGTWMFDAPETGRDRVPKSQVRRSYRLARRTHRSRSQRMARLHELFIGWGLGSANGHDARHCNQVNPWEMRAAGLDRVLRPAELVAALAHIAKRRGFRSTRKGGQVAAPDDGQKKLKALEVMRRALAGYRTVGEMFALDPEFRRRKRNREGVFDRSVAREDLLHEVCTLFEAQRGLGNKAASRDLEAAFISIAFDQTGLQDSEKLVGMCPFEPDQRRAARHAPSFERFRLLHKLVSLRIATPDGERCLTPSEIAIAAEPGGTARVTAREVRKRIGLPDAHRFTGIPPELENRDIVLRTGDAMYGTRTLRDILGDAVWTGLLAAPEVPDRIAQIMSFYSSAGSVEAELGKLGLPASAVEALMAQTDAFSRFKGAGHISAKAARALIPHLEAGLGYPAACAAAGYDLAATRMWCSGQVKDKQDFNRLVEGVCKEVGNPVMRKSLTEGLKQLWAMRNRWGLPDGICLVLSREVSASPLKRAEIARGIEQGAALRERLRNELCDLARAEATDGSDWVDRLDADALVRFRLWKEQKGRCPYTDEAIPLAAVMAGHEHFCMDHILPWSRFGDDSLSNKVLCAAEARRDKQDRTPFEWFMATQGKEGWARFVARVEENRGLRGARKRNLVHCQAGTMEERMRLRNLRDSGFAPRLFAEAVETFYPPGERTDGENDERVVVRPSSLTAALSRAWGLEALKGPADSRLPDARHQALDALTAAMTGEPRMRALRHSFRQWERKGLARSLRDADPPWADAERFAGQLERVYADILVAWPERRRARGEGHAATIRQVRQRDGMPVVFARQAISDLPEERLVDIKDAERNRSMIEAIRQWMAEGRSADRLPRSPAGHEIRKVRVRTRAKPAVRVRGGSADRGEIVRVDVFSKPNRRGKDEFYLVPVYPHQVMNKRVWPLPPMQAVAACKEERDWPQIDDSFSFRFSLFARSYVEVEKPSGEVLAGYFQGVNRATGAIALFNDRDFRTRRDDRGRSLNGIGVKTVLAIRKFQVDRFGRRFEVGSEPRTWHGRVCVPRALSDYGERRAPGAGSDGAGIET